MCALAHVDEVGSAAVRATASLGARFGIPFDCGHRDARRVACFAVLCCCGVVSRGEINNQKRETLNMMINFPRRVGEKHTVRSFVVRVFVPAERGLHCSIVIASMYS